MSTNEHRVPLELLTSFLNHAIEALQQKTKLKGDNDDSNTGSATGENLANLRKAVLDIQLSCLESSLVEYNKTASAPIQMESVQRVLREVGGGTFDNVSIPPTTGDTEEAQSNLTAAIVSMNEAARCALARLVLRQEFGKGGAALTEKETPWEDDNKDGTPLIPSSDMMEFCGLCRATWKLEEVQTYLRDGTAPFSEKESHPSLRVQDRMDHIQTAILRALGYDWKLAVREMRRILQPKPAPGGEGQVADNQDNGNDREEEEEEEEEEELRQAVRHFVAEATSALTEATLGYRTDARTGMPSDQSDGGVTRVVSVQYSEKVVNLDDGSTTTTSAPLEEQMDSRSPAKDRQARDWEMARQAASLQQSILAQLLQMEPDERDAALAHAKQVHDDFLKEALALPAGPERVSFMQSVDGATQRLLIMHKLWESMLAQHGGQPPVMRRAPR